jgi:hypothetical protein
MDCAGGGRSGTNGAELVIDASQKVVGLDGRASESRGVMRKMTSTRENQIVANRLGGRSSL